MSEKLIITLTVHSHWGAMLQPVLVREEPSGGLTILEVVGSKSTFFAQLSLVERELVLQAEKVSDRVLMKNFSKETNVAEFHKKVSKETTERYIRPNIEGYHRKVVQCLQVSDLELYHRDGIKNRVLYDVDRILIPKGLSQVVFNFKKDIEAGFRYFITVKGQEERIDLFSKSHFMLCGEPATLLIGNTLHVFSDIDFKKLLPFFTKRHIEVPASAEQNYIKTFVRNCVEKYEVQVEGVDIEQIIPDKKAILTLDADWTMMPVLHLNFSYGERSYGLDSVDKKYVFAAEGATGTSITWHYLDKAWEKSLVDLLLAGGLEKSGLNHFSIPKRNQEEDTDASMATIVEWLQFHPEILEHFEFTQNIPDKRYFLGEISVLKNINKKQDWFDLHIVALFGPFKIPFIRFRNHILKNIPEYVLPDGTIAILPKVWFTRYYELMLFSAEKKEVLVLKKLHFKIVDEIEAAEQYETIAPTERVGEVPTPAKLRAELRNYQQKGFSWLVNLYENNFGGCLADDMGLGKTLQTIALLQHIAGLYQQANVIEPPTIADENDVKLSEPSDNVTERQLSIFDMLEALPVVTTPVAASEPSTPTSLVVMPTSLLHNWQNELRRFAPNLKVYLYSGTKRLKSADIHKVFKFYDVVITTYGTLRNDIDLLQTCSFHHLILDESQYVKNPDSLIYKAVKQIRAQHKLALTGTPIENSLTDLWAQLNIVNEGVLGSLSSFQRAYIHPINKQNKVKEEALLRIIAPFILRRTKNEVAPELPELSQETVYCDMSETQQTRYDEEKNKLRSSILVNDNDLDAQKMAFLTLQGLTRLRLLANHPKLWEEEYEGDSGKFEQVIMRLETLKSENHKVLIFSSFVKHLRMLANHFDKEEWKYSWLSGSTAASSRESEIDKFTKNEDVNCFLISLKAGGVGLNLTAADYVFILDPWWNPASEMQALGRAHRIGQKKNVMVYRFISTGTIEEKIRNLQESKSKLADTFVGASNPLKGLNKEELVHLIE
jgi:SNF2 family DNA or RNA helicase